MHANTQAVYVSSSSLRIDSIPHYLVTSWWAAGTKKQSSGAWGAFTLLKMHVIVCKEHFFLFSALGTEWGGKICSSCVWGKNRFALQAGRRGKLLPQPFNCFTLWAQRLLLNKSFIIGAFIGRFDLSRKIGEVGEGEFPHRWRRQTQHCTRKHKLTRSLSSCGCDHACCWMMLTRVVSNHSLRGVPL